MFNRNRRRELTTPLLRFKSSQTRRVVACFVGLSLGFWIGFHPAFAGCYPNPAGLVGWWPGDGNANNVLGTNNGTLSGGATANVGGMVGMAFNFDGTNNFVQIPDSVVLKPTNLTVEAWVRFNNLDSAGTAAVGRQYIVFKQNSFTTNFAGYDLSKVRVSGSDRFLFRVSSSGSQAASVYSTTLVSTGVWYHVMGVRGSNFLQIYVNGQFQAQTNVAFAQNYGTLPLYFGSSGQPSLDRKFRGTLDEVSLYNRVLTSNEIAAVFAAGADGKCKGVNIVTQPQSQVAVTGSNATFTVAATGFGSLSYRWRYNGTNLVNATNTSFAITNVQPANAGNYTAVVTNILGAATSGVAVLTIVAPPFITNAPQSQTVVVGANVNFSVGAGGTVPLSYQWRKGGAALGGQTNGSLALLSVSTNDAGSYDVVVSNVAGSVTSTPPAILTVNAPPFISSPPQNQTVVVGANVNFTVGAGGTVPLGYQWRKNGSSLNGQTNAVLALSSISTNEAGNYEVVVSNVAGSITSSPPATLTVNVPAFVATPPQSQTVAMGANVNFTVGAGGTLPLSYQWRKAGSSLIGQTSATLALSSVTTNDAGGYDVVVSNVAGSVTSAPPATLTVNVPPFITNLPQSQTVVAGANVTFSVGAAGTTPLGYQWRKGGLILSGQTGDSLGLLSVSTNDAGSYDVVVTNVAGTVTSTPPATLTVNVLPFITSVPQSQTVNVGANVNLSVGAGGSAPLSYQWRKGGAPLSGQTNSSIVFASIATGDAGSYDVVVTNVAGMATSTPPATLTVNVPPFITNAPQSQTVVVGANVNFSVGAGGTAPLSFQWRKGGAPLNGQTGVTLALASVTTANAGSYDVVVTNGSGSVTSTPAATLTVNVLPFITNAPQSQTVAAGANVNFSVGAGGTVPLSYQWRKAGAPLAGQTSSTLFLANVTTNESGNYDVVVTNMAGSVTSTPMATLTVIVTPDQPPVITSTPQSQATVAGANVNIAVVANGTAPLRYQWRKAGLPLPSQTNATLTLLAVTTNNVGSYDVVVTNVVAAVTSSPPATLTVLPTISLQPIITKAPQSQRAGVGTDVVFVVGAEGSAPLSYQWRKGGSPLVGQTGATLALSGVAINDDGNYDVVVGNMAGSVTSVVATLAVKLVVDPYLEKAIACALSNQPVSLSLTDLSSLGRLSARNRGITNLFGLQFATNLTSLDLSQNAITDLTPLQGLGQLNSLELNENENHGGVDNLSPLAGLTNLTCLVLGQIYAGNYAPLSSLTNLTSLAVREGSVGELDFIRPLSRLVSLDLSQNNITNVSALAGLTNLSSLDLRWNYITNQSSLWSGPTNLASLYLGGNPLNNAPSLQSLPYLTHLNLDDCRIRNLLPLAGLTNLNYLDLSRNPITNYPALSGLTSVVHLELSGNPINTLGFITSLWRLTYANLSYSGITNLTSLTGLTNLNGLVLAGNPLLNFASLSVLPGVSNLWLHNSSISNAGFVATLPWLAHLNLDDNFIPSLTPILGLTNLTGLGLSRNPATNFSAVAALTKLRSLRLEGNLLADVSALSSLTQLTFLSLNRNRITNALPLGVLTNLQSCYLGQNRLQNIQVLESLPRLYEVDVSLNLVHPTNGSPEWSVIEGLWCRETGVPLCACAVPANSLPGRGVNISYLPQHQQPKITAPVAWFIPPNTSALFDFNVSYEVVPSDPLPVSGNSSNPGLIPNGNLVFTGTNYDRTMTVTATTNQPNTTTLTLTVVNEAGLSSNAAVAVTVVAPISVTNYTVPPGTPLDPILKSAIQSGSGNYSGEPTIVDLLNVTTLSAEGASFAGFAGWQWLTNLTTMYIGGSAISNLNFLTNLPQLTSLGLYDCVATDYSPLASLTNLKSLDLAGNTISNLSVLATLTELNYLQLNRTRVAELSPLAGLTNLNYASLQHNMLTNIISLYSLPRLAYVDLRLNLLDLAAGSTSWAVIQGLANRGVRVEVYLQRAPPLIPITPAWNISANRTSTLSFNIYENGEATFDLVALAGASANAALIPNANVFVGLDSGSSSVEWALRVTPAINQTGTTVITLSATNDVGLHSSTTIVVTVSAPLPLDDEFFGMTDLTWQTGGNVPWFGQTSISMEGYPAAQSGGISHGEISTLESALIGPGTLSFWWKVSSETNYDFLVFESPLITNRISGEVDWQNQTVTIPPREQTVRWRYTKDANAIGGMDAGWLAHVTFVPAIWLELTGPPTNGHFHIALYGVPGQEYEMQVSTNLVDWELLTTLESTNRITPFIDVFGTNGIRFYRAKAIVSSPLLSLSGQTNEGLELSWSGIGVLQGSATPSGPWHEIGGVSPCYISTGFAPAQFFRVRVTSQ